jgi:hypothetical protein
MEKKSLITLATEPLLLSIFVCFTHGSKARVFVRRKLKLDKDKKLSLFVWRGKYLSILAPEASVI